jgi:hypothetical protein
MNLLLLFVTAQITRTIPNTITTGPVDVQENSGYGLFDGQKITPRPNATTYEWYVLFLSQYPRLPTNTLACFS